VPRKRFDEKQDRDRDLRGTKKVLTGQINLREDHHLTKQLTRMQIRKNERRQSKKNNGRQKAAPTTQRIGKISDLEEAKNKRQKHFFIEIKQY
jgi:hypothetical protein